MCKYREIHEKNYKYHILCVYINVCNLKTKSRYDIDTIANKTDDWTFEAWTRVRAPDAPMRGPSMSSCQVVKLSTDVSGSCRWW